MFGTEMKTNGMKLVAMVMIMAMIVAGAAVVLSDNGVDATPKDQSFIQSGENKISENIEINVDKTFDSTTYPKEISFVKATATAERYTVTLTMEANDDGTLMFNGVDISVGDGITLILNMTTASTITTPFVGNHIIQDGDLTISGSGIVEFKQSAMAQGITYCSLDTTDGNNLKLSDSAKLIFNGANGVSEINVTTTETSSIEFNGASSGKVALGFAVTDIGAGTSVIMKDSKGFFYMDGKTTINGTLDAGASEIKFPDKTAKVTIGTTGSVTASQITGEVTADNFTNDGELNAKMQLTNDAGKVTYLNGPVSSNDVELAEGAILEDVTVNPGVTLKINGTATVEGDMRVYGTLAPTTVPTGYEKTATLTVDGKNSITAYNGSSISKGLNVIGTSEKIDISAAMSTITVNDDVDMPFFGTQSQKVVIADTLTIKSGWTMEILGELVINEGCTLIIEDDATLALGKNVDSDTVIKAAKMTVNGNITVEEGGKINVIGAQDVTVVGEIYSSGIVTIKSNVTVENGGSIVIDDSDDSEITVNGGLTIKAGGELSVAGDMTITSAEVGKSAIDNYGTITLNGANIKADSTISMAASGAVVDIKSMTQEPGANLTVTDLGMVMGKDKDGKDVPVLDAGKNNVFFQSTASSLVGVRGVSITSNVTSEVDGKDVTYSNSLIISGSATIFDNTDDGNYPGKYAIKANGGGSIEVPESFTIGKNIEFTLNAGTMNVDGTMTATADGSKIVSNGEIYVNGMITTDIDSAITDGINAFHYSDDDYNYYTTLKTAIDNSADEIDYYGNVKVLDTLTIPADTEVKKSNNGETITIGDEDNRDVIVTVASGATMRNCVVDVKGTLVFDDNKTGNRNDRVDSDVIIDAEPKRTYTNIYTALEDAADNSTVKINRNVYLDKDAEIRETITLEIPAGTGVYLYDEVTLTVNGTVKNSGALGNANGADAANKPIAGVGFNPKTEDHAAIIVNGTVMSMEELPYGTYYIVGAYYQLVNDQGAWNYITPVEQAAAVSNDVENGIIEIYGENTVADVTFTGDKGQAVTVTVTADGALAAGTITLDRAGLVVEGDFTGTAASAAGSVKAVNATGFSVIDTYNGETEVTYLDGTPVIDDDEKKESSVTVATGTINAGQIDLTVANASDFDIAEGATLKVAGQYDKANAEIKATAMTVNGTLIATDKGNVDVTTMTVRGTFTVEAANEEAKTDAGTATIVTLYVGIAKEMSKDGKISYFVDASSAAVNADQIEKLTTMYVSGESTATGKLIEKLQYTTGFYVEDTLWMTIYTSNNRMAIDNSLQPGDLVNSEFSYWADSDGEVIDTDNPVNVGEEEKVYANLNYNIYTVTVFADPGITAVYIDGKLMTSGVFKNNENMWNEGFQLTVAAGEHEITYKLGNYFSGEAKMTVNGSAVEGNTFTTSGTTPADKDVTIYLQGIEASAPETPSSGDSGMGLTDYLLIILVVLIVIMAIMVAMRLMRS